MKNNKQKLIVPKLKDMPEENLKKWEEELNKKGYDCMNKYMVDQIKRGKGWIF